MVETRRVGTATIAIIAGLMAYTQTMEERYIIYGLIAIIVVKESLAEKGII